MDQVEVKKDFTDLHNAIKQDMDFRDGNVVPRKYHLNYNMLPQTDSGHLIDTIPIGNAPLNIKTGELIEKLEKLNAQVTERRNNIKKLLADMAELQVRYNAKNVYDVIKQKNLQPITLDSATMLIMTLSELEQLERINDVYSAPKDDINMETFVAAMENIKQKLSLESSALIVLNNERSDIQSELMMAHGSAQTRVLSGEEIISGAFFKCLSDSIL